MQQFSGCFLTMARTPEGEVTYRSEIEKWLIGEKLLSDAKLFSFLNKVCDIVRYYVLWSWDSCIFSTWNTTMYQEVVKTEKEMDIIESVVIID